MEKTYTIIKHSIKLLAPILLLAISCCTMLCSCSASENTTDTLSIAYQYGIAYAPIIICQEQDLIEKNYESSTGQKLSITWNQMSSGADINTGIASGKLNIGFLGIAPALNGISNKVGYKIFCNISGQPHSLMTNDDTLSSLGDIIDQEKQIALVNTGSIQHIILAKALSDNGYDPHALDSYIVAMKHPDGMNALISGSLPCHLTTMPYISIEEKKDNIHEIQEVSASWSAENSFIVGVASTTIYNNPDLYNAVCDAIAEAIDYINSNPEDAAKITCKYTGNTYEDELIYIQSGFYSTKTTGIMELASFMYTNGFINNELKEYTEVVYSNVSGD